MNGCISLQDRIIHMLEFLSCWQVYIQDGVYIIKMKNSKDAINYAGNNQKTNC